MAAEGRLRRSARVFLFDPAGDVLLIRVVAPLEDGPFVFWVTPGGEMESGEGAREAAERELFEELGIRPQLTGPVHEESGGSYVHLGETVRNFDVFFAGRCAREAPRLLGVTAEELALMQEARWWSLAEIETTTERLFPANIAALAREIWTVTVQSKA
jgi:ADP-ribose pyrophosphatase YjhB (NUDIX family)